MDMDLNLKKLGHFFQGVMLYLQNHPKILWLVLLDDICLKSSTKLYGSIFYKGKALSNDFSTELDPKQQNVRNN